MHPARHWRWAGCFFRRPDKQRTGRCYETGAGLMMRMVGRRFAPLFPLTRCPTKNAVPGPAWRRLGKPQASPNAFDRDPSREARISDGVGAECVRATFSPSSAAWTCTCTACVGRQASTSTGTHPPKSPSATWPRSLPSRMVYNPAATHRRGKRQDSADWFAGSCLGQEAV